MEESELKEFESVKDTNLESTVGGHRHSRAYHDGWVAGKVANIIGTVATLAAPFFCVAMRNKNKN